MKKNMKKNTRKNHYNGKNIFGQSCHTKIVEVNKETAMDQLKDILAALDGNANCRTEYSMVFTGFTEEEVMEFDKSLLAIASRIAGRPFNFFGCRRHPPGLESVAC